MLFNGVRAVLLTGLLAGVSALWAQSDRGTIEGSLVDPSGAAVSGARVLVVQLETNHTFEFTANEMGRYFAANLPLGTYRVTVRQDGFRAAVREPILIQAQTRARVDFTLVVGNVTESVEVTAEPPLLDPSTATLATGLTTKFIQELPLIQLGEKRNITSYIQNTPGLANPGSTAPKLNGSAFNASEVFIDGAPGSEVSYHGTVEEAGPGIEHVGEFSVVTNSFDAEYGRTGNWFTSVTIRSGTNHLHGSLFDNFANDKLNARSFFQAERQRVRQNEGGFTLGGPVYLPKIYDGRNKTFFFFGQDLFYMRQAGSGALQTIPRQDFRAGDFSNLLDASGVMLPIFDPDTTRADGKGSFVRDAFPGNRIPSARISKAAAQMVALMPAPDLPSAQSQNWHNRTGTWPYLNTYVSTMKFDHSLSGKQKVAFTYSDQLRPRLLNNRGWGNDGGVLEGYRNQNLHSYMGRINHDYIFRANLLNHFTVGMDRYHNPTKTISIGSNWDQKLGITGFPWDDGAFPVVDFSGGTASPLGLSGSTASITGSGRYSFTENLTWIHGRHTAKFGVAHYREHNNQFSGNNGAGVFVFTNSATSQPNGGSNFSKWGSSFASFLLGNVNQASTLSPITTGWRWRFWSAFAQDEWHVSPRLTVSYGLRWEFYPSAFEVCDRWSAFDPATPNPGAGGIPGALIFAGSGPGRTGKTALADGFYLAAAPRLAIAYQINSKTVLRASTGIYYAPAGAGTGSGSFQKGSSTGFTTSPSFTSPDGFSPLYNWGTGSFPQNFARPPFIDPTFSNNQSTSALTSDYTRPPQILSWTFGVQRELARDLALDVSYIGSHSTHLAVSSPVDAVDARYLYLGPTLTQSITSSAAAAAGVRNPFPGFETYSTHTVAQALMPYPQYTGVSWNAAAGIARFHSLQAKTTKRYSNGMTVIAFYTWTKNLTNAEGSPQYPFNRAAETAVSSDGAPHVFSLSAAYDLPFGPGRRYLSRGGPGAWIAGGWQLAAFVRRASGTALTVSTSNNLSILGYGSKRANVVVGQPIHASNSADFDPATMYYLNTAAFAIPGSYEFGNTARVLDWVRGPMKASEAISLMKRTKVAERFTTVFRADVQNPFNAVRWGDPITNRTDANFGRITSADPGRLVQLNLTVEF